MGPATPYHTIPYRTQVALITSQVTAYGLPGDNSRASVAEYFILNTTGHGGPPQKRRWELRVLVGELRLHAASVKPDYGMLR